MGSSLFAPFTIRPRIGVRLIVQSHFGSFAGAIFADLSSSDDQTVLQSLELLRVCLLLVEDCITEFVRDLIHALLKILTTDEQNQQVIVSHLICKV